MFNGIGKLYAKDNGGGMTQTPKQFVVQMPFTGGDTVEVKLTYNRGSEKVTETRNVPKALMHALTDPGETGLSALDAMRQLAGFYKDIITPELDSVVIEGIPSVPASILSSMIQASYSKHAVVAATEKSTSKGLFLRDRKVDKLLRLSAALLTNQTVEQIEKLDLDDTTFFVNRTVTTVEQSTSVKMTTKSLECDRGSHREVRKVSVPDGTTVEEEQNRTEQKIASMPKVYDTLEQAYTEIERKRGSNLGEEEKNAVISHMNITYIEKPEDRLPVIMSGKGQ